MQYSMLPTLLFWVAALWTAAFTVLSDRNFRNSAIGGAIHHIGNVHKYVRPEDVPEHIMFVITTDGMENAGRRYNSEKVKQMIERQKAKYGWEFLFLGDNIDAVETASTSKCFFENPKNDSLRFFLWQELTLKHPERMHSPMQQAAFYGDWEVSTTSRAFVSRKSLNIWHNF